MKEYVKVIENNLKKLTLSGSSGETDHILEEHSVLMIAQVCVSTSVYVSTSHLCSSTAGQKKSLRVPRQANQTDYSARKSCRMSGVSCPAVLLAEHTLLCVENEALKLRNNREEWSLDQKRF